MLIDTAIIVKESLVGVAHPLPQPAPKPKIKLTPDQRTRLEFLLKKLRIFGEANRYHNAAYIDTLLCGGEDRQTQFFPSPDCLAVVETILEQVDEALMPGHLPILPGKEALASD